MPLQKPFTLKIKIYIAIIFSSVFSDAPAQVSVLETFESPNQWQHYEIAERPSSFQIYKDKVGIDENSYLKILSNNSSSMLVLNQEFEWSSNIKLKWKWKVQNVYQKGDLEAKAYEDYPAMILVIFQYEKDKMDVIDQMNYKIWKNVMDREPPHSTLRFIWANRPHQKEIYATPSPPPNEKIVILQAGSEKCGSWQNEEVDVVSYYKAAFGKAPPKKFTLAIVSDSDNTREASESYLDDLEIQCE